MSDRERSFLLHVPITAGSAIHAHEEYCASRSKGRKYLEVKLKKEKRPDQKIKTVPPSFYLLTQKEMLPGNL